MKKGLKIFGFGLTFLLGIFLLGVFFFGTSELSESPLVFYSMPYVGLILVVWSALSVFKVKSEQSLKRIAFAVGVFGILGLLLFLVSLFGL